MDFYGKDHILTPLLWKTLQERINTMIFNSLQFLIFFPIILVSYYIIPHRLQNIWLLFASYIFYGFWNVKYCLILFICTLVTYLAALAIESVRTEFSLKKRVFIIALLFVLGILAGYKYTNFAVGNLISLFEKLGVHTRLHKFDIVLPVGISFFTFQAAGYLIDVYKGKISAEKDLIRYGLFISFFPQLLSGPIGRADMLLPQYSKERNFQYENFQSGLLLMIWGFFLKLVIADRAAILVDTVYGDFTKYTGLTIVFATAIYGVQIYCDFFGYSSMAIGSAKILGIDLPNNFDTPYLSASVKEFLEKMAYFFKFLAQGLCLFSTWRKPLFHNQKIFQSGDDIFCERNLARLEMVFYLLGTAPWLLPDYRRSARACPQNDLLKITDQHTDRNF